MGRRSAIVLLGFFLSIPAYAQDLVISGVIDGPLSGGLPKAVEVFVINDIADLSQCGVGGANNGGGSDGQEFTFPAEPASAGSYLYVASESSQFTAFFGFAPNYTSSAASINGDDAIELFCNGSVIDVFGDINVDGSGEPWEYLDGWAYRVSDTGPDGNVFNLSNWLFSGPNALDFETSNATAEIPFPIASFSGGGGDLAPQVVTTAPADGDSNVPVDTSIEIEFSEAVTVTPGAWFDISCSISGSVGATDASADGVTFTLTPSVTLSEGETCTVTVLASEIADVDAEDPPDQPNGDFVFAFNTVSGLAPSLIINEINADPDTANGDANNDGTPQFSDDEFVELVNVSGGDLDISGWTLADGFTVRHIFDEGTVIPDQCAIVVFGGGTPTGSFGGALTQTASSGALGLNNGGDTITIATDAALEVLSESYGGNAGANQSITRDPDLTGGFVQHTSATGSGGRLFSPGTLVDGTAFAGCDSEPVLTSIHDIQGSGRASPLQGQPVTFEGVVTGDFQDGDADEQSNLRGFYVQEDMPDADPLTSEGIFVFDALITSVAVAPGDRVRVSGTVTEFFGDTQITASAVEVIGSGSITPTPISLPAVNVVANSNGDLIADLEQYEGMLVTLSQPLTVSELFNLDRFGEILLVEGERLFQFTNFNRPDVAGVAAYQASIAARAIMLDDGLSIQNPDPIRYPSPGLPNNVGAAVRIGDTVSGVTGNIRFSRGSGGSGDELYRLMPTQEPVFVSQNPRPVTPPSVSGSLVAASFNVLNYFTTPDGMGSICGPAMNQGCRGADSVEEFERQREKLLTSLLEIDADILGLIELENNALASLQDLADGLNAILADDIFAIIDTGTIGGDAIKVGILYRTDTVTPIGNFALLDTSVDPRFIDTLNRPTLAQSFVHGETGGEFTFVVNHLKSKGSNCNSVGDPDLNDGQGNCNLTRLGAVQALIDWIETDPTGIDDPDYLITGDLNAYSEEDPIVALEDAGLSNLLDEFVGVNAYSFVFDGQAGALDHAFATPNLASQVTGAAEWHINADEADAFDYNLDFGRNPNIFEGDIPFRVADHDPLIVGMDLDSDLFGDVDGDGDLDLDDRALIRESFGRRGRASGNYNPDADLNDDGRVGPRDLRIFDRLLDDFNGGGGR